MHQGDGIEKTYREKTELDRNIECKGAYSVAEFVFAGTFGNGWPRYWDRLGNLQKRRNTNEYSKFE